MAEPITEEEKQSWGDKLEAARLGMIAKLKDAVTAYKVYSFGREKFGVGLTDPNGWSDQDHQSLLNLQEIVRLGADAIVDALSGKREVELNPKLGIAKIAGLASDPYLVRFGPGGTLQIVTNTPAETPVNASGQIGAAVWLLVIAAVALVGAIVIEYEHTQEAMKQLDVQKEKLNSQTQLDLQNKCAELVASKTYTPEQCQALVKQIEDGQAAIKQAEAAGKAAEQPIGKTITETLSTGLKIVTVAGIFGLVYWAATTFVPARKAAT